MISNQARVLLIVVSGVIRTIQLFSCLTCKLAFLVALTCVVGGNAVIAPVTSQKRLLALGRSNLFAVTYIVVILLL